MHVSPTRDEAQSNMGPPLPPQPAAVPAQLAPTTSLMKPSPAKPSVSTIATRAQLVLAKAQSSMRNPSAAHSAQGLTRSEATTSQRPLPYAGLPVIASSHTSMQPSVSMEQVAQLLNSVNAARPSELALHNDIRRLNEEV